MSNKISLDLTANTSQAEKAVADLANDIDKLQKKATQTKIEGGGRGSRYSRSRGSKEESIAQRSKASNADRATTDALKNALSGLTDKLGTFGQSLQNAAQNVSGLVEKIAYARMAFAGIPSVMQKARRTTQRALARNMEGPDGQRVMARRRTAFEDAARLKARSQTLHNWATGANGYTWSDRSLQRMGEMKARLDRQRREFGRQRMADEVSFMYGPTDGKRSARQLKNLARWQWGYAAGTRVFPSEMAMGVKPGRLRAVGTYLRGGLAGMSEGARARLAGVEAGANELGRIMGFGQMGTWAKGRIAATGPALAGAAVGAGIGAIGGGIYGAATGAGAGLGLGALSLPFLLNRASGRVDAGRGKAEEFAKLNAQLSVLAKNLTGSGDSAKVLAEQIQKMGIEGSVPVEQLSRGASMLMLAFKGNQTETSKWLNILGDMSAGTGQSVEYFAELITKANQFGTVEFEVFNQLNEKGIPIIDQLKGKFGDTREEIMKAAQAGKITAAEFMKAFEAAHKASMEGTNAVRGAATLTDLRRQRAEYEQMEAAHYTQAYDAEMMDYERSRTDRAKRRSEDASFESEAKALGNMLAEISSFFKRLRDFMSDWTQDVAHWFAKQTGLVDSQAKLDIANINLYNTGTRVMEQGIKAVAPDRAFRTRQEELRKAVDEDGIDDIERARRRVTLADFESDYWYSSAELSGALESAKDNRDKLERMANDDDYDDETRAKARAGLTEAEDLVRNLENALEEATKREQEIAEARRVVAAEEARLKTAEETRTEFLRDNAKTDREMLDAYGFNGVADVEREMEAIKRRILDQSAEDPEAEAKRYEELADLLEAIQKYRDAQRKDAEQAAKQAEEAAKREAKARRDRELYLLEREAHRNPENYEAAYQLQFEQQADKLKSLGFSDTEASEMIAEDRAEAIRNAERRLATNDEAMQKEKQAIEDNKKTGVEGIENAWGAVQRTMTSFTSPYEQSQLKELQKVNDNLVKEIDALNRINLPPTAR